MQDQPTLAEQGQKCHLLGYGKDIKRSQAQGDIDILFGSYLEIVSAEREEELKLWPMSNFLQEIIDEKIGANSDEFRDYIRNLLEHLEERHRANILSKHLFANKKLGSLASATGAVVIMNTGNALYAVPLSSIIDLGVNLKISVAEELSQKIEPPSRYEHSRGIDMEKYFHGVDMEKYSHGMNWEEYSRNVETEQRSRGIDRDREM